MAEKVDLYRLTELLSERSGEARVIVAIAGPPGVGKSTFCAELCDRINRVAFGSCEILQMDGYHFDNAYLKTKGWLARKGAPFTFDVGGMHAMLARLKANDELEISVPVFDRDIEIARAGARMISNPTNVVLVEGNYLLLAKTPWDSLHKFFDVSIMLQTPAATLKSRLLARWTGLGFTAQKAEKKAGDNDLQNVREVIENSIVADFIVDTAGKITD